MESTLIKMLLTALVFDHFALVSLEDDGDYHVLRLDEKNAPPQRHNHTYASKGFFPSVEIQDFTLRGKPVCLKVRKRKWLEEQTGNIVSNSFKLSQPGTHLSPEFAAFLKESHRG